MNGVRRVILALLLAPAVGLLVFGPRPRVAVPKGRVVVQYWEKWTGREEAQMRQIVDEFNDTVGREKNIFVRYLSMSSVSQKVLVATAAGVPPDVAGIWDGQLVQFAALDALEPLDDLASQHGFDASLYKPVYWEGCHYDGHLWALVSTPGAIALHYNKKLFREAAPRLRAAGLDPNRPPGTIDELDRYADVLDRWGEPGAGGRRQLECAGYLPSEPGWYISFTSYWFGGRLFDPQTNRFTLTEPQNVAAFEWLQKYSKKLGEGAVVEFRSGVGTYSSGQNAFLVDKVAMEQQGPWMANLINELKPGVMSELLAPKEKEFSLPRRTDNYDWAAAPFPSAVPGMQDVTYCPFDALAIPRGAMHRREAFEFIAYVNRQDVMEKLCALHCKNSPLAKVSDEFVARHPNPYIEVFERLSRSPNARGLPQVPIWPEVNAEMGEMAQAVILLKKSPADALQDAQVRVQAKYDAYLELQRGREQKRSTIARPAVN